MSEKKSLFSGHPAKTVHLMTLLTLSMVAFWGILLFFDRAFSAATSSAARCNPRDPDLIKDSLGDPYKFMFPSFRATIHEYFYYTATG